MSIFKKEIVEYHAKNGTQATADKIAREAIEAMQRDRESAKNGGKK